MIWRSTTHGFTMVSMDLHSGIIVGLSARSTTILGSMVHGGEAPGTIIGDGTIIVGDGDGTAHGILDGVPDGIQATLDGDMADSQTMLQAEATVV